MLKFVIAVATYLRHIVQKNHFMPPWDNSLHDPGRVGELVTTPTEYVYYLLQIL